MQREVKSIKISKLQYDVLKTIAEKEGRLVGKVLEKAVDQYIAKHIKKGADGG
jgi:hypothetical protein